MLTSQMEAILSHNPTTSMAMSLSSAFLGSRMRSKSSLQLAYKEGVKSVQVMAAETNKKVVPFSNYAVPIDDLAGSSFMTRPLAEILRDMNKRVPDKVIKTRYDRGAVLKYIPWYHANRMLSFYAPGWSGEVRSITYSADGKTVTVVYRVTLRGSDGEAYRESTGTSFLDDVQYGDPVQKAEGMAFRRACARFGLVDLRLEIDHDYDEGRLYLHQSRHIQKILDDFEMTYCKGTNNSSDK
ncbi:hypothetical protein O6H91_02G128700 [Diphasiastrum complanatum]|uniref:Uncharacterized protein n=1 Tax=Diphasiastrum complanatum TaxID=34168 RepID=A0ACC2EKQ8_DIPCM|nr:hypothetical protein O6H91_02G128700 [Diphasiastrum complanatum]